MWQTEGFPCPPRPSIPLNHGSAPLAEGALTSLLWHRILSWIFLPLPYGIIFHSNVMLQESVVIMHQVTLGGQDLASSAPSTEDGVYLGAGANVFGGVSIGRCTTLGANSRVTKDSHATSFC